MQRKESKCVVSKGTTKEWKFSRKKEETLSFCQKKAFLFIRTHSIFFFFLLFLPFFSIDRKIFSYRTRIITILYDYSYTRIYLLYSVWLIKIRIQIYLHIEILILFISRKRRGNKNAFILILYMVIVQGIKRRNKDDILLCEYWQTRRDYVINWR